MIFALALETERKLIHRGAEACFASVPGGGAKWGKEKVSGLNNASLHMIALHRSTGNPRKWCDGGYRWLDPGRSGRICRSVRKLPLRLLKPSREKHSNQRVPESRVIQCGDRSRQVLPHPPTTRWLPPCMTGVPTSAPSKPSSGTSGCIPSTDTRVGLKKLLERGPAVLCVVDQAAFIALNPAAELDLPKLPRSLPKAVLTHAEVESVLQQPDTTTVAGPATIERC